MDALPKLSLEQVEEFKRRIHAQADQFVERMLDSVERARKGRLIADSEEPAREAIHAFGEAAFEAAVQLKIDAAEASFFPSAGSGDRSGDAAAGASPAAEQGTTETNCADDHR
ncbi:MAG: hypothetical protein DWQ29_23485 [Planctomycetota bacterium]|nr:MAG: hypothetical protein DWQ29_23485 [Planctomycetota bacterium]